MTRTAVRYLNLLLLAFILPVGASALTTEEAEMVVTMRTIGHEVLKSLGDNTSRVLPIEQDSNKYRIPFEAEFGFDPAMIAPLVDSVMAEVSENYIVAVEQCSSGEIVHSYVIRTPVIPGALPCVGRELPEDCYNLVITLLSPPAYDDEVVETEVLPEAEPSRPINLAFVILPIVALVGVLGVRLRRKTHEEELGPDQLMVGQSTFDKRTSILTVGDSQQELSYKESELLLLLLAHANQPVERKVLLEKVWGDEGDYVGRTLDVFISKLRKKLEGDSTIKIANIRGVGYKLILESN